MRFFVLVFLFSSFCYAAEWGHVLEKDIKILDETILQKVYPNVKRPSLHSAITLTDYLRGLDVNYKMISSKCFRPQISRWNVTSTIYIRPKMVEGPDGSRYPNPRWKELKDFRCRKKDPDYNLYEATYQHETIHYKQRDAILKSFWKELKVDLKTYCGNTRKEAEDWLTNIVKQFLLEVIKADTEVKPRAFEEEWIKISYEKKEQKKCGDFSFIGEAISGAKVKENNGKVVVSGPRGEFTGINKGYLTLLKNKKTGETLYFQYGVIAARESVDKKGKIRTEYNVDGLVKHKLWLDSEGRVIAKAWANNNGKLGRKVMLKNHDNFAENPVVTIIDTGFESSDIDGHGTFVQSIIQKKSGLQNEKVQSLKVSTNIDESFLRALGEAKGKIINLSIGQKKFGKNPAKMEMVTRVCKKIEDISKTKLVIIAAGNDGASFERNPFYPADCSWKNNSNIIVVGSFDNINKISADFGRGSSNWSSDKLDLMVTGNMYKGKYPGGVEFIRGGTSFAASYVSGLAAFLHKSGVKVSSLKKKVIDKTQVDEKAKRFVQKGRVLIR